MYFVYLLKSINTSQTYTGFTLDVVGRLKVHNNGGCPHTAKYKPWELVAYFAFPDKRTALAFEKYLKSGSGRVFAKRRFFLCS